MGHLKNFVIMVGEEVEMLVVLLAAATARRESLRSCLKVFMLVILIDFTTKMDSQNL